MCSARCASLIFPRITSARFIVLPLYLFWCFGVPLLFFFPHSGTFRPTLTCVSEHIRGVVLGVLVLLFHSHCRATRRPHLVPRWAKNQPDRNMLLWRIECEVANNLNLRVCSNYFHDADYEHSLSILHLLRQSRRLLRPTHWAIPNLSLPVVEPSE